MTTESVTHRTSDTLPATPPEPGTVEVDVFGPGYGESVLVHLGDGRWLVVDSCAPAHDAEPAALSYLRRLGVDPARAVSYLVATHWHDDHIRGFARLVRECRRAEVFLSQALTYGPLMRLIRVNLPRGVTSVREMHDSIDTLLRRRRRRGPPYRFLLEHTAVHDVAQHGDAVEIWALSPSSADVLQALRTLRPFLQADPEGRLPAGVPDARENHASVVLHVRAGRQLLLLGADRERLTNAGRGWRSVTVCAGQRGLPPATFFKVPHHGSPNGDDPLIWQSLLDPDPVAVLSPFRRGVGGGRPRSEDAARLCARTPWAFTTSATPRAGQPAGGLPEFLDPLAPVGIEVHGAQGAIGQVRARAPVGGGPWTVELIGPAAQLCS